MSCIYLLTNVVNKKVYVGKTKGDPLFRWREHVHDANNGSILPFHCALRKYGVENFQLSTLVLGDYSREDLNNLEKQFISDYQSYPPNLGFGYNSSPGGDGGAEIALGPKSQATRDKISKSRLGYVVPREQVERQRAKLLGRKQSPEHIKKRLAHLGDRNHKNLGRTLSPEWRAHISLGLLKWNRNKTEVKA